jgi:hypothetical protein
MGGTIDKILGIGDQGGADVRDGSMHRGFSTTLRDNTKSTQEYLNVVYGTILVGGNQVFITSSGKNNKYLWVVMNIGEGECQGIKQRDGVDQVFLDDKLYTELGSTFEYWFYNGTSTQTFDTNLNGVFPEWTDNKRHTCYIVCKITYNGDLYQRVPKILIEMEGKKVYDFRDTVTKFSNNPVLVLYDFMTSDRYGTGLSASKIDITSWTAAANYCDTKNWTMNGAITKRKAQDIMDSILQLFRGNLTWYDGKYYLKYRDSNYESVVMTLTDYHIMQSSNGQMQVKVAAPSRFNTADGMRVKFKDPEQRYIEDDFIIGDSLGKIEELNLSLTCTDRDHAAQIGVYNLERLKLNRQVTGTFRDDCFQLDPGDLVNVTFSPIQVQGTMRVDEMQVNANGSVDLNLIFESPLLYDDDYNLIVKDVYECILPDPNAIPPSVTNITVVEDTAHYRGRTFTRLIYDFDVPDGALWSHVEVWRSFDGVDYEHVFNVVDTFNIDNAIDGQTYYVKLRSVSLYGVKQTLANAPLVTWGVLGEDENPPPSPLYLSAILNQSAVNLYSDKLADPDIEVYEFRIGSTWSGGTYIGSLRAPNMNIPGMKPGTYTFWMNTLGTNKLYGTTPVSATITLPDPPPGWTLYDSFSYFYNLIGNGNFEEGTTGWSGQNCTIASVAGGQAGNCLQITRTAGVWQQAYQSIDPPFVESVAIFFNFYVKSGTSGDQAFEVGLWNNTANQWVSAGSPYSSTSTGSWVQHNGSMTIGATDINDDVWVVLRKDTGTAGTMLFDSVVFYAFIPATGSDFRYFRNCEYTLYNNDDYLKCSHTGQDVQNNEWSFKGAAGAYLHWAQRWSPFRDIDGEITYARMMLRKEVGSPTGNMYLYIYPDDGSDLPDYGAGAIATSDAFDVSTLGGTFEWVQFDFSTPFQLTEDEVYYLVLKGDDFTGDSSNDVAIGYDTFNSWGSGVAGYLSTGGWTQYDTDDLAFQIDEFCGRWISRIVDIGAEDDYLTYSDFETVQVGGGNLWSDIGATTNTWDDINATGLTWGELVQLDAAGKVYVKILWGDTESTINKSASKQEFLSTIVDSCEFIRVQVTIVDPNNEIYMHVSELEQRFLT